jgi:CBS domain-containing protein
LLGSGHSAYPVQGSDGRIAGLVTLAQLRRVPPAQRDTTRLVDIAIAIPDVAIAAPRDSVVSLLDRLIPEAGGRALVFDHGELVGILTPIDVARAAELRGLRDGRHVTAP